MESLIPIIGTLLGGAIAIAGGYINQISGHQRQRLTENRNRTACKLEEAAQFAEAVVDSGQRIRIDILGIPVGAKKDDQNKNQSKGENFESKELIRILRLYEPALLPEATALVEAKNTVGSFSVNQLMKWTEEEPTIETYEKFSSESEQLANHMQECYEVFMEALTKRFIDYRL